MGDWFDGVGVVDVGEVFDFVCCCFFVVCGGFFFFGYWCYEFIVLIYLEVDELCLFFFECYLI